MSGNVQHDRKRKERLDALAALHPEVEQLQRERQAATERAAELAKANQALQRSVSQLADMQDVALFIDTVLQSIIEQTGATSVALFRYDRNAATVRMQALTLHGERIDIQNDPRTELWRRAYPISSFQVGWQAMLALPQGYFVEKVDAQEAGMAAGVAAWHLAMGHHTIAHFPLLRGEESVGFIGLAFATPFPLTPDKIELVRALAQQATLAIELARLADQARQSAIAKAQEKAAVERAAELASVNTVLQNSLGRLSASDGPEAFLAHILTEIARAIEASSLFLFRYDPAENRLALHLSYLNGILRSGRCGDEFAIFAASFPADITPAFEIMCRERRFFTPANSPIPAEEFAWPGVMEELSCRNPSDVAHLALLVGETPVGSLGFEFQNGKRLREEDQPLVMALAQQAAIALRLSGLAEQERLTTVAREREKAAQARATELEKINTALQRGVERVTGEMGLDALLGALLLEAIQVCGAAGGGITGWKQGRFDRHHCIAQDGVVVPTSKWEHEAIFRDTAEVLGRDAGGFTSELLSAPVSRVRVEDARAWWPAAAEYHARRGHVEVWNIPCAIRGELVAHLGLAFREPRSMTESSVGTLTALAQQMTLALELTRLADKAKQSAIAREQEKAAQERAAELVKANEGLQAEIVERNRAEQVSRGQTEAMIRALNVLAAEPTLDAFLGHVLCAIATQLNTSMCALYLHDRPTDTLSLHMTYHEGQVMQGVEQLGHPSAAHPFPAHLNGFWQVLIDTRSPVTIRDIANDVLLQHHNWLSQNGIRSLLIVPLLLGDEVIGCLGVRSKVVRDYAPEEIELAQALAHQITLAINTTRMAEQSRHSAVLAERNRMAREIHDTLAQGFTGIAVQLEATKRALPVEAEQALQYITQARELALHCLEQARRSIWALRPQSLEHSGLVSALTENVARLTANSSVHARVQSQGDACPLPPPVEEQLYRIAQEAVTNAVKHARAHTIWVELLYMPDAVRLTIRDDGSGFALRKPGSSDQSGFGLISMRERAHQIGGQIAFASEPGQGTQVTVLAPHTTLQGDTNHG